MGTPQYDEEYQAVKSFGWRNSTTRDAYNNLSPYFWADDVSEYLFRSAATHQSLLARLHWYACTTFLKHAELKCLKAVHRACCTSLYVKRVYALQQAQGISATSLQLQPCPSATSRKLA